MTLKSGRSNRSLESLWAHHDREFRDPLEVSTQWKDARAVDPKLLRFQVEGDWWDSLASTAQTLFITREYEHLVIALSVHDGNQEASYLRLPHPNGLAVDHTQARLYVASTRNPNMIYEFLPCNGLEHRHGTPDFSIERRVLLPIKCRYLPGCLYIHDLALIGGSLFANAVAMNAIVRLPDQGGYQRVWWPRSIDDRNGKYFDRNYLQLNSIAAGKTVKESFFSASAAIPSTRRPGHLNFAVNRRGVIFSGKTRAVIATGLTRPHSARLIDGKIWVANSGYGEVGVISGGKLEAVTKLPGWTRGLCARNGILFAATSRVIPRFQHYAPGLDCDKSQSGVHAISLTSGKVLGSIYWPLGNQVFALEGINASRTAGFPQRSSGKSSETSLQRTFFHGVATPS